MVRAVIYSFQERDLAIEGGGELTRMDVEPLEGLKPLNNLNTLNNRNIRTKGLAKKGTGTKSSTK